MKCIFRVPTVSRAWDPQSKNKIKINAPSKNKNEKQILKKLKEKKRKREVTSQLGFDCEKFLICVNFSKRGIDHRFRGFRFPPFLSRSPLKGSEFIPLHPPRLSFPISPKFDANLRRERNRKVCA